MSYAVLRRIISLMLRGLVLASAFWLAGCAKQERHQLIGEVGIRAPDEAILASHEVFIVTTRAHVNDLHEVFSGARAPTPFYAMTNVTVPTIHKVGYIERPSDSLANPAKYFTATGVARYGNSKMFSSALRSEIKARGGRVLVYIHGFNTQFDDAVYRITQISQDANYKGVPVLFTWASAGKPFDYVYDTNSAMAARDALEDTLRLVVSSGATRVDIVAHSLGNWLTMEALRQLAMTNDRDLSGKLGNVVLAAPDIDVDVFKSQMRRYGKPSRPFIVLASNRDRVLDMSSWLAGSKPRLGDYLDTKDIADYGVVVVNMSDIKGNDGLNHSIFAENPTMVKLLGIDLNRDDAGRLGDGTVTSKVSSLATGSDGAIARAASVGMNASAGVPR
ncbi:alpha/beta hydrolase [Rhizobium sp. BR 314]|uniref:alpha/beta hydrolase n=1 Tax=Rhizobium sp. BR 314 TaxID=3040013 RepID=UPI0039BF1D45